jgi:ferredoxin
MEMMMRMHLLRARVLSVAMLACFFGVTSASFAQTTAPSTTQSKKPAKSTAIPEGAYATEADAKAKCPTDTIVWANLKSKVWHYAGTADYGKTKKGAYMCEKQASTSGFRAAKGEKHP